MEDGGNEKCPLNQKMRWAALLYSVGQFIIGWGLLDNTVEAFEAVCHAAEGHFIANLGYGGMCLETG